jgi:hypothetical protein
MTAGGGKLLELQPRGWKMEGGLWLFHRRATPLESRLEETLERRFRLVKGQIGRYLRKGGGKIEIEYYSDEDIERLVGIIIPD